MGCGDDDVVGESPDPMSQATARVRKDMHKTSAIMADVNGKITSSSIRQPFKDLWSDLYSRWLDYTKGSPVLKANGSSPTLSNSELGRIEDAVLDYRKRALLMYEAWKKEMKQRGIETGEEGSSSSSGSDRTELFDPKNVDKWKAAKWGLGLIAVIATIWGGRKLLASWQEEKREKERREREEKRLDRLERLGLIDPMSGFGGGQAPNQALASPTVTPVTIVMPQGAMFASAPQVAVSNPARSESSRDVASRVMRALPPAPPPLFPRNQRYAPPEPPDSDFEMPDGGFGSPEPQGY